MKFIKLFLFLIAPVALLANTSNAEKGRAYRASVVGNILSRSAEKFEKQYPIYPIGTLIGMPGGIVQKLGLDFQSKRLLTKEEIRKIVVSCVCDFLKEINSDKRLRPIMCTYPFLLDNIDITIYNVLEDGGNIYDPEIGTASIFDGHIVYKTWGNTDPISIKNRMTEPFADAHKALLSPSS